QFNAGPTDSDSDQTPSAPVTFGIKINGLGGKQESESFYHDSYVTADLGERASLIVGANYFHDAGYEKARATTSSYDAHARTEAWSVYADGYYDLTDALRIVGGVRYSDETKEYERR